MSPPPDPANSVSLPADYLPKVKKVHSEGGFGSQGYGYDWKLEEAQKNLLRTHTTAVSARMLRQLAQEKVRVHGHERGEWESSVWGWMIGHGE